MYSTARHHSGNFELNVSKKPKEAGKPEKNGESPEKQASQQPGNKTALEIQAEKSAGGVDNTGLI